MTSSAKLQKDKFGGTPRLAPRPTAASAARAARNATNRNLASPAIQKHSPNRTNTLNKENKSNPRYTTRTDTKSEHNRNDHIESASDIAKHEPEKLITIVDVADEQSDVGYAETQDVRDTDSFSIPRKDSRPSSPLKSSRPQTPKSTSSRPPTPRLSSRPTTPLRPRSGPGSRPNTPHHTTPVLQTVSVTLPHKGPSRQSSPQTPTVQPTPAPPPAQPAHQTEPESPITLAVLTSEFKRKQLEFQKMKLELDVKQQAALEVFQYMKDIRERVAQEGIDADREGLVQQDLVVFSVTNWANEDISQIYRNSSQEQNIDAKEVFSVTTPIDENTLLDLDAKVLEMPGRFAELCIQAFTARQELIDWVKDLVEGKQEEEGSGECVERIANYNAQGLELCDSLRDLKAYADAALNTVAQISKRACRERSMLIAAGESLVHEVGRLRHDLEDRAEAISKTREAYSENDDTTKELEATRQELEEERAMKNTLKEKLANSESQLRQTRQRINKMDRQLREAEASIASLTGTVKTLEDQSRQRELQLEARARKLKESLKTGEVASSQISQQRDHLIAEVAELKAHIEDVTTQHKAIVQDLNNKLKDLKLSLENQKNATQREIEVKEAAESELASKENLIVELKAKLTELERKMPNPDLPTEREMDLWAELQATKETMRTTEEEVINCKREKVRFLETLTKISESENKVGMQQKLAAELLSKEEVIGKMQMQIRELTKNIKLSEQKVIQYEQYVRDLQAHSRAIAEGEEIQNDAYYQNLQQEIMNLRMGLLEAVHRNEELNEVLMQKEQQLEQQDKTARAQARVIKVREELINMLKNKETEQSRELTALQQDLEHRMKIVDEVNKQIAAKADEIQELFTTLENKQQQIHRLEKIVLALEEQQRRAQAQRTRHEEKIAALEHELAAGTRRERKFIFF